MNLCENVAKCVGLSLPRAVDFSSERLAVSEARFEIVTARGFEKGQMLFWNEDAQQVEHLSLGKVYRFSALAKKCDESTLMFYVPKCTKFTELSPEEVKKIVFQAAPSISEWISYGSSTTRFEKSSFCPVP